MKLATCMYNSELRLAVVQADSALLPATCPGWSPEVDSMLQVIDRCDRYLPALRELVQQSAPGLWVELDSVELVSPIPRPRQNVMCLGWNYMDHVEETTRKMVEAPKLPKYPVVFTKAVSSMNGPYAGIPVNHAISDKMYWEVELGVIIGKGGQGIRREQALQHVFGYTVINDVSARDLQKRHRQFFLGKSLAGSCPMGPWIVTSDEIPDPQALDLESRVNGQVKQDSNTRHQIFDIATVIETLSRGMRLEPGDIIATGTPSGVGYVRTPPEYLQPGDVVECEIESIGTIRNTVTAA